MGLQRSVKSDEVFSVPCPPFELRLSHWDRLFPPTHSKRILCFSLPPVFNKTWTTQCLKIAFHNTVQRVPFLAGSVVPFPKDQGGRPWIRDIKPCGSAHLIVRHLEDKLDFEKLQESNFSQDLLDTEQLCPLPRVAYVSEDPVDVCRFQANFVKGGLLLVVSIIHIAADGRGVTDIIKIFAKQLRASQEQSKPGQLLELFLASPNTEYRSDRMSLVSGNVAAGDIGRHTAWTSSLSNAHSQIENVQSTCRTFRIDSRSLADLKDFVSSASLGPDDWFSTNDAISGLIWRSIMIARLGAGLLSGQAVDTYAAQALDCRPHLKLPEPYFGNVLYMAQASVPMHDLQDAPRGLAFAARALRADVNSMTAEKFRNLVGYAERTEKDAHTRMSIIEKLSTQGIIMTSHFKFDQHGLDFGPIFGDGRIKALRFPARGTMAGAVIIMPRLPDGSCEFMITEREETIQCLLNDEVLGRFTRVDNPVLGRVQEPPTPVEYDERCHRKNNEQTPDPGPSHVLSTQRLIQGADWSTFKENSTLVVKDDPAPHMGNIRIIEMNRPNARNAISLQMLHDLEKELQKVDQDLLDTPANAPRVLVLASAVDGVFCAGADLKERKSMSIGQTQAYLTSLRNLLSRLASLPIPSIACISGAALGGGLELALACQFRVASLDTILGFPETRMAIIPGAGGTYRLPRLIGLSRAADLVLTGRQVGAREGFEIGLCNRLVEDASHGNKLDSRRLNTLSASVVMANEIARGGPTAVRAAVAALSWSCPAGEHAAYESLLHTTDRREGLLAFSEKRKPIYTGE